MRRIVMVLVLAAAGLWQACGSADNLPHCTMDCSAVCKANGSCQCRVFPESDTDPGGDECTPVSDSDCAQSDGCTQQGQCELADGPYSPCTVVQSSDCTNSAICKSMGACSLLSEDGLDGGDGMGDCVAQSSSDCQQSEACKSGGYCTFGAQECCANQSGYCQD